MSSATKRAGGSQPRGGTTPHRGCSTSARGPGSGGTGSPTTPPPSARAGIQPETRAAPAQTPARAPAPGTGITLCVVSVARAPPDQYLGGGFLGLCETSALVGASSSSPGCKAQGPSPKAWTNTPNPLSPLLASPVSAGRSSACGTRGINRTASGKKHLGHKYPTKCCGPFLLDLTCLLINCHIFLPAAKACFMPVNEAGFCCL